MEGSGHHGSSVDKFLRNYKLGKTLSIGSFGKVKIAEHALAGHKVAIRILNRRKIKNMDMEEKVSIRFSTAPGSCKPLVSDIDLLSTLIRSSLNEIEGMRTFYIRETS